MDLLIAATRNGRRRPGCCRPLRRLLQPRVYGFALTVLGSAALAEEVSQEAFIRVWEHAAAYDARSGEVATRLLTITRKPRDRRAAAVRGAASRPAAADRVPRRA